MMIKKLLFILLSLFTNCTLAKDFVIAAIYPKNNDTIAGMYITSIVVQKAQQHGLKVKLILLDDQNTLSGVFTAANKAVDLKVDAVIGTENVQQAFVAAEILERAKVPFFVPMAMNPNLTKDKQYIVTILPFANELCQLMSKVILEKHKPKRITIVRNVSMPSSSYYADHIPQIMRKISPSVKVTIIDMFEGYKDYRKLTEEILATNPEVLCLPLYREHVSNILTFLSHSSRPMNIYVSGSPDIVLDENKYYKLLLSNNKKIKVYVFTIWTGKYNNNSLSKEYIKLITNSGGKIHSDLGAALAYDVINFLLLTIAKNPSTTGVALIKAAKRIIFEGVTGTFRYNKKGEVIRNPVSFVI